MRSGILVQLYLGVVDFCCQSREKISTGLALVSLLFDKRLETTSGVVAHVYGLLAERGVNVLEEMSCWTELLMVIEERDLASTLECLKFGKE
jgi:aspartokinase